MNLNQLLSNLLSNRRGEAAHGGGPGPFEAEILICLMIATLIGEIRDPGRRAAPAPRRAAARRPRQPPR